MFLVTCQLFTCQLPSISQRKFVETRLLAYVLRGKMKTGDWLITRKTMYACDITRKRTYTCLNR